MQANISNVNAIVCRFVWAISIQLSQTMDNDNPILSMVDINIVICWFFSQLILNGVIRTKIMGRDNPTAIIVNINIRK